MQSCGTATGPSASGLHDQMHSPHKEDTPVIKSLGISLPDDEHPGSLIVRLSRTDLEPQTDTSVPVINTDLASRSVSEMTARQHLDPLPALLEIQALSRQIFSDIEKKKYETFLEHKDTENKHSQLLKYFKIMLEELFPASNFHSTALKVMAKAKAIEHLGLPLCDDACFLLLSRWLSKNHSPASIVMMEVVFAPSETKETQEPKNHYFLFLPKNPEIPFSPEETGKVILPLKMDGWIIDPKLHVHQPIKSYWDSYCELVQNQYRYPLSDETEVKCVFELKGRTEDWQLNALDHRWIERQVNHLLPMAILYYFKCVRGKDLVINFYAYLSKLTIKPSDFAPMYMAEGVPWGVPALQSLMPYCKRFIPITDGDKYIAWHGLSSFRTDTTEYLACLKVMVEDLVTKYPRDYVLDFLSRSHQTKTHQGEYLCKIPEHDAIDVQYHNTLLWHDAGEQVFKVLGVEVAPNQQNLKDFFENPKNYNQSQTSLARTLGREYRSLWSGLESLKPEVKMDELPRFLMIRHLAHTVGQLPPKIVGEWGPLDTLRVCKPSSVEYQNAMKAFFAGIHQGINPSMVVEWFNAECPGSKSSEHPLRVSLPDYLVRAGVKQWDAKSLQTVLAAEGLANPFDDSPESFLSAYLTKIITEIKSEMASEPDRIIIERIVKVLHSDYEKGGLPQVDSYLNHLGINKIIHEWRALGDRRILLRCLQHYLDLAMPDSLKARLAFDNLALSLLTEDEAARKALLVSHIKDKLKQGSTLSLIALELRDDKRYPSMLPGIPEKETLDYFKVKAFLEANGESLEQLKSDYKESADVLIIESQLFTSNPKRPLTDGGILSHFYYQAKKVKMPDCIVNYDVKFGELSKRIKLINFYQDRYRFLQKEYHGMPVQGEKIRFPDLSLRKPTTRALGDKREANIEGQPSPKRSQT